jgi:hypothetical protein
MDDANPNRGHPNLGLPNLHSNGEIPNLELPNLHSNGENPNLGLPNPHPNRGQLVHPNLVHAAAQVGTDCGSRQSVVADLQQSEQIDQPPLVGPCLHTIRNQDLMVPFEGSEAWADGTFFFLECREAASAGRRPLCCA